MKTTLRMRTSLANPPSPIGRTPLTPKGDPTATAAFCFLMGSLLLALIFFILLPFFI